MLPALLGKRCWELWVSPDPSVGACHQSRADPALGVFSWKQSALCGALCLSHRKGLILRMWTERKAPGTLQGRCRLPRQPPRSELARQPPTSNPSASRCPARLQPASRDGGWGCALRRWSLCPGGWPEGPAWGWPQSPRPICPQPSRQKDQLSTGEKRQPQMSLHQLLC